MDSAEKKNGSQKIFSIILATFNSGQKVEVTIQSILSQKRELFELIVIDGASVDNTLDYVRKYEGDLRLISEKDTGVYDAYNKGIELATGRYLYFIGAGDCLREGVLETVNQSLPSSGAPSLVYGDAFVVNNRLLYGGEYCGLRLKTQNICHQAAFYHRDIFKLLGKYDLRYVIFSDWAMNLKCFGDRRIRKQYLQYVIADFEGDGLSATGDGDTNFKKDFPRLIRRYLGIKSYLDYRLPILSTVIYRKIYFPFFRPWVSAVRRLKPSSSRNGG